MLPSRTCGSCSSWPAICSAGLFITKFRKMFTRDEMAEDLVMVPARVGEQEDNSEYEEILPVSPP